MQNNGLVEKEEKIQLKLEDKSSDPAKRTVLKSAKSMKPAEKAIPKNHDQKIKKMLQKRKIEKAAEDNASTRPKGSKAMLPVEKVSKQTLEGQEKNAALLKEEEKRSMEYKSSEPKTQSMKRKQRSASPFSVPNNESPQQYPPAVVPLVQLPVVAKNNNGNGGGGQDVIPFKDKAWIVSNGFPEQVCLLQSFMSRADWFGSQWVNAPPTKPPRMASSLFM